MSIYLSSMQKAVTGGTGVSSETSLWGMQDKIQLKRLSESLIIHAVTGGDQFLTPTLVEKTDDPAVNNSAYFWYLMLEQGYATPGLLISPNDKGWVEEYEQGEFVVDLQSMSNVSYAHMPLFGERLKKHWNPNGGKFPILGNRGPEDGVEGTYSTTLDADGIWRGHVVFADGSIDWQEGTVMMTKWRRNEGYIDDNIFLMEDEASADDAILGFSYEMDDYGPVFVWD